MDKKSRRVLLTVLSNSVIRPGVAAAAAPDWSLTRGGGSGGGRKLFIVICRSMASRPDGNSGAQGLFKYCHTRRRTAVDGNVLDECTSINTTVVKFIDHPDGYEGGKVECFGKLISTTQGNNYIIKYIY